MPGKRILVLGGTSDAVEFANATIEAGFEVVTSLAGVTTSPKLPAGEVRTGGFGGAAGLSAFLKQDQFSAVVDATHPFASVISRNAYEAASQLSLPLIRIERPAWVAAEGDSWNPVPDIAAAVAALPPGTRVFLTIGRKEIAAFIARKDLTGMARMIEPPPHALPPGWTLNLARPPFPLEEEVGLMRLEAFTHLVTKNAGGKLTEAKLAAARALALPVVMIDRPAEAPGTGRTDCRTSIAAPGANILLLTLPSNPACLDTSNAQ